MAAPLVTEQENHCPVPKQQVLLHSEVHLDGPCPPSAMPATPRSAGSGRSADLRADARRRAPRRRLRRRARREWRLGADRPEVRLRYGPADGRVLGEARQRAHVQHRDRERGEIFRHALGVLHVAGERDVLGVRARAQARSLCFWRCDRGRQVALPGDGHGAHPRAAVRGRAAEVGHAVGRTSGGWRAGHPRGRDARRRRADLHGPGGRGAAVEGRASD